MLVGLMCERDEPPCDQTADEHDDLGCTCSCCRHERAWQRRLEVLVEGGLARWGIDALELDW